MVILGGGPSASRAASGLTNEDTDDWRDIGSTNSSVDAYDNEYLERQQAYFTRLDQLHRAGLPLGHVFALLRTWTQGAYVHLIRALPMADQWAQKVDEQVTRLLNELLQTTLDVSQVNQSWLKIKDGGMGLGSAVLRRESAFIGAWERWFVRCHVNHRCRLHHGPTQLMGKLGCHGGQVRYRSKT